MKSFRPSRSIVTVVHSLWYLGVKRIKSPTALSFIRVKLNRNYNQHYCLHCQPSVVIQIQNFCTTNWVKQNEKGGGSTVKSLTLREEVFQREESRNKKTFITALESYEKRDRLRRGHVEFIYSALKFMEEFGVHKDLAVYKKLLEIFPKGKFIAKNMFQVEFMHYPKQQQCGIDVLDQMESFGVMPDSEVKEILINTFGKQSHVFRKYGRMMYWMPKFKNITPFPLPDPLPKDPLELAKLALRRISVDLQTEISEWNAEELEDSLDKTWIVGSQSPLQRQLLEQHPDDQAVYIEGSFIVWLRQMAVSYFIMRANPKKYPAKEEDLDDVSNITLTMFDHHPESKELMLEPSIHEQEDGTILAMCATGTSSRDSLLSWIRFLQHTNPCLKKIPVVFTLKSPSKELVTVAVNEQESSIAESQEGCKKIPTRDKLSNVSSNEDSSSRTPSKDIADR
ncbi:evolutionarily conserved signaling intermediate in Toll pathway, mitochondrial-like isoform X2 [Limulus polyphemus]|nr:evolutionarily conserved signaling intermediate in Toll pathway, mitochondrial-like isoform X2 [Limulus polyphemus]